MLGDPPSAYVHVLHIGKTGGTAVREALCEHTELPACRVYLHWHDTRLRDVPVGDGVVFFLRDPVQRFVSGFYSRQRQGEPRFSAPWSDDERSAFETFGSPEALASALGSADVAIRERAVHAMQSIQHVQASYWNWFESEAYFESRMSDLWFIGFQETLDADFERLKARLGAPAHLSLPTDEVRAHRNPSNLPRTLSAAATAQLERWYARDVELVKRCRQLVDDHLLPAAHPESDVRAHRST